MALSFTEKRSIRKNFGKLKEILSIPNHNLVESTAGQIVDVYFKRGDDEYYSGSSRKKSCMMSYQLL